MPLDGLGVDQVGGQRAGIGPEQRVRQRAVAPEHPGEVQPDQQLDEGVEQLVGRVLPAWGGEQPAVGHRVLEVAGDQDGLLVVRRGRRRCRAPRPSAAPPPELAEQGVLLAGQPLVDLLQREDVPVVGDEPDDVPGDAALRAPPSAGAGSHCSSGWCQGSASRPVASAAGGRKRNRMARSHRGRTSRSRCHRRGSLSRPPSPRPAPRASWPAGPPG